MKGHCYVQNGSIFEYSGIVQRFSNKTKTLGEIGCNNKDNKVTAFVFRKDASKNL